MIRRIFLITVLLVVIATIVIYPAPVQADPLEGSTVYLPIVTRNAGESTELDNPGFEEGYTGWKFNSPYGGGDIITSAQVHSGTYAARLGSAVDNYRQADISQKVNIPNDQPKLSFWHYIVSEEEICPDAARYDYATVEINDVEVAYYRLCNDEAGTVPNGVWIQNIVDLSAYKNQVVTLKVFFHSDSNLPSDYYVDEFSFVP